MAALAAVIVAYVKRGDAPPLWREHYTATIRMFWIWLILSIIGLPLILVFGLGFLVMAVATIWTAVVGVLGLTINLGDWDTHRENFDRVKANSETLDRGLGTLIMEVHQKQRNHICRLCKKGFSRAEKLKQHEEQVHDPEELKGVKPVPVKGVATSLLKIP